MEKESREKQIYRVTIVGSIANFFLLVFKFVAGILGQSSAMIADAVHSLSDFVTDIIVLVFVKVSAKPKDAGHDYGHGKYETLATAIIGIVLLMVGSDVNAIPFLLFRPCRAAIPEEQRCKVQPGHADRCRRGNDADRQENAQ